MYFGGVKRTPLCFEMTVLGFQLRDLPVVLPVQCFVQSDSGYAWWPSSLVDLALDSCPRISTGLCPLVAVSQAGCTLQYPWWE